MVGAGVTTTADAAAPGGLLPELPRMALAALILIRRKRPPLHQQAVVSAAMVAAAVMMDLRLPLATAVEVAGRVKAIR